MSKFLRCLPLLPLALLAACASPPPLISPPETSAPATGSTGNVGFSSASVSELPHWQEQQFSGALAAFRQSCRVVAKQPAWSSPCGDLAGLNPQDNDAIRQFFEARFTAWKMHDGARDSGLITGYYEPAIKGSLTRSDRMPYPVYGVPGDLLTLAVPASVRAAGQGVARRVSANRLAWVPGAVEAGPGQVTVMLSDFTAQSQTVIKGRIQDGRLVPYYSRAQIARGMGVNHAPVLAWVGDPVELFFMQIQGAGRIHLDNGQVLRVGVGDNNGYGYQSIGRWLADHGEMPLSGASMTGIQSWVRAHPDQQDALFNTNPRYIFFRAMPEADGGPVGTLGVPLTDGYSIAVDPHYIPLGAPVYLATTWPSSQQPLTRLVAAQDTGNAIRGPIRADFFWGFGDEAGENAGRMKASGSLWLLLPNGVQPSN